MTTTTRDGRATSVPRGPARRRPSFARWRANGGPAAVVLALPAFLVFLYFAWGPIVRAVAMSFEKTNLVGPSIWVGLSNFTYVLGDPLLPKAVVNTLLYLVLSILFGFPLPILLAVFIAEVRKRSWVFSALAYLPVVIPPVVSILLWKTFYDPGSSGTFNTILGWFGIGPLPWLNSTSGAVPSIILEATWASAGTAVIIYLAALTGVRTELYEAAELDGSGIWSRIWHITLPQIRGVILIMLLLQIIGVMQIFTEPYIFTGGGPQNATLTVLLMIYNYAFVNSDYGAATALSVLLAIVLALFSFGFQRVTRRWGND